MTRVLRHWPQAFLERYASQIGTRWRVSDTTCCTIWDINVYPATYEQQVRHLGEFSEDQKHSAEEIVNRHGKDIESSYDPMHHKEDLN